MGKTFSGLSTQDSTPRGLYMRPGGSQFFMMGDGGNSLYRYSLSTNYDISTSSYDTGQVLSTGLSVVWQGIWMNNAGTKLYATDTTNDRIYQWTLSTAWDLTSATSDGFFDTSSEATGPKDIATSDDGTTFYVYDSVTTTVYEYDLTTAHDITGTVTYNSNNLSTGTQQSLTRSLHMEGDSVDHLIIADFNDVDRYTLGTAWTISTAAFDTGQTYVRTENPGNLYYTMFADNGEHFYDVDHNDRITQYDMSTAWDVTTASFDPPIASDGAVSLTPTVSGTTTTDHQHADGAVTITPTISAGATNETLHSTAAVSITPTISAEATGTIHADGAVSIAPTIAGTGEVLVGIVGAVSITPTIAATGEVFAVMHAAVSIPAMTADAAMEQVLPSSMTMAPLTITGEIAPGAFAEGAMTLPLLEVLAAGDNTADVALPSLVAEGAMLSSAVAVGDMRIPALILTSGVGDDRFLDADLSLPSLTMVGNSVNSPIVEGNMTIPLLSVFGVNAAGSVATGVAALPVFTMDSLVSALVSAGLLTADLTLPALEAQGYMQITATLTHSGWAFNTESLRTSEYDNYNYVLVANAFGKTIGVAADGIYELTGDTDNTVDIDADVLFGFDSFRTEDLKRVKAVHIGYRADNAGDLNIQIVVDGEDKIREYSVKHVSSTSGLKRGRATPAKGLKSRYWQYGVKNVAGADFTVDDLSIFVQQHNRKVQ